MPEIDFTGLLCLLAWVTMLGFLFAKVEIQIEGKDGWAAQLPTWRVEKHWLLDLLWGGRPMTGYHAWIFPFMLLICHLGFFITGVWTWKLELRAFAVSIIFWIVEDFFWFVFNPAYGIKAFRKDRVPWHPRWLCGVPADYCYLGIPSIAAVVWTFLR
jgi:hypothetical protein